MWFFYPYLSPPHQIFLNGNGLESNGFSLPLSLGYSQIDPLWLRAEKRPNANVAFWLLGPRALHGREREGRHQSVGPKTPV